MNYIQKKLLKKLKIKQNNNTFKSLGKKVANLLLQKQNGGKRKTSKNATIDGFTNQTEGFATRNASSSALFPSTPTGLNIMQNTTYNSGKSLKILDKMN